MNATVTELYPRQPEEGHNVTHSLNEYIKEISETWKQTTTDYVSGVIKTGQKLIDAQKEHGESLRKMAERLPFSWSTAGQLMKVAEKLACVAVPHRQKLPPSWATLHLLAILPEPVLTAALADGRIHPEMTRSDARALKPNENTDKPKATPNKPKGAAKPERQETGNEQQNPVRVNVTKQEYDGFAAKAHKEGSSAAEKLAEFVREPKVDRDDLSLTAQQKFDAALRQKDKERERLFHQQVDARVEQRMKEIMIPAFQKRLEQADRVLKSRKGIMPRAMFLKILSCLHPDSRNSTSEEKLNEAFNYFKKYETVICKEAELPTQSPSLPKTLAEWEALRQKVQEEKKAKRAQSSYGSTPRH